MEPSPGAEAPTTNEPTRKRGRPSQDKQVRLLRRDLETNRREFEDYRRQTDEIIGLLKSIAEKQEGGVQEVEPGVIVHGGLDRKSVIQMIREFGRGDDRRPDYFPLDGDERAALDQIDPLGWIDEKTDFVEFVGRTGSIPLRQRWVTANGVVIRKLKLQKHLTVRWMNCPYVFGGKTAGDVETNALMNRDWHFFRLTRRDATEMWRGRDPFPMEAVVRPADLANVIEGEAVGTKIRSSGIAMREAVRFVLQTNRTMIWLNTDSYSPNWDGRMNRPPYGIHPDKFPRVIHEWIDPREPNPYSTGCPNATTQYGDVLYPVSPAAFMANQGWSAAQDTEALLAKHLRKF